ncbi:GNAT family N-acetyltransferase [Mesorhizobium sp. BAC0120]|uniref:GNAT family N-acetyltransferase n=1 Tax=Mesorhizobium sp. BAC0120 TaxID=3090670 RepID=UPI00298C47DA|nr:GNAT family N-acetyltransferase [Mesorhizobium sp. BAC0120]MDW6026043.1 GNAT family N-acetyltransferase [Mesorhizobium sp. BAC0120]
MAAPNISIGTLLADFGHWDDLLSMIRASFAYMDGVIDPPSSVHRLTPAVLRAKAQAETCFLATADRPPARGEILAIAQSMVGCAFLAEKEDHFYLGKLAVLPAYQGKGVGRQLLMAAQNHAIHAGKPVIELQTRVELTGNHRKFASFGFVETDRTAHPGFDRPTTLTMRKALA